MAASAFRRQRQPQLLSGNSKNPQNPFLSHLQTPSPLPLRSNDSAVKIQEAQSSPLDSGGGEMSVGKIHPETLSLYTASLPISHKFTNSCGGEMFAQNIHPENLPLSTGSHRLGVFKKSFAPISHKFIDSCGDEMFAQKIHPENLPLSTGSHRLGVKNSFSKVRRQSSPSISLKSLDSGDAECTTVRKIHAVIPKSQSPSIDLGGGEEIEVRKSHQKTLALPIGSHVLRKAMRVQRSAFRRDQEQGNLSTSSPIETDRALNPANVKKGKSSESYNCSSKKQKKEHRGSGGGGGGGGDDDDDDGGDGHDDDHDGGGDDDGDDQLGEDEASMLTVEDALQDASERISRTEISRNYDVRGASVLYLLLSKFLRRVSLGKKIKRKDGSERRLLRPPIVFSGRGGLMRKLAEVNRIRPHILSGECCSIFTRDHQTCVSRCSLRPSFMRGKVTADMVLFFVPRTVIDRLVDKIGHRPWEEYRPFFDTLVRLIWSLHSPSLDPIRGFKKARKEVQSVVNELEAASEGQHVNTEVKRSCRKHLRAALTSMKW